MYVREGLVARLLLFSPPRIFTDNKGRSVMLKQKLLTKFLLRFCTCKKFICCSLVARTATFEQPVNFLQVGNRRRNYHEAVFASTSQNDPYCNERSRVSSVQSPFTFQPPFFILQDSFKSAVRVVVLRKSLYGTITC